ncbi:MAG: hypothetical protein MJ091_04290 [Clostridia bacterium]|nr:hypothetical protein [Clostridia bacterium]
MLYKCNGEIAKKVIAEKNIPYKSKEEFFEAIDSITADINAVVYNDGGTISIKYKK